MKLTELLAKIGDENLKFQRLAVALTGGSCPAQRGTKDPECTLTFATARENAQQAMRQIITGKPADEVGLVVWIPRAKLPEEFRGL